MISLNTRSSPINTAVAAPIDELRPRELTPEAEPLGPPPEPLDTFALATGAGARPATPEPAPGVASDPELVRGVAATRLEISLQPANVRLARGMEASPPTAQPVGERRGGGRRAYTVDGEAPASTPEPADTADAAGTQVAKAADPGPPARNTSPATVDPDVFDWQSYVGRYPDLQAAGIDTEAAATEHWQTYGIQERRQASAGFSAQAYLDANPDVKAATHDDPAGAIEHYVAYGRAEGRSLGALAGPVQAGSSAAIPPGGLHAGNDTVQVGVSPRTGGAINSLVVNGHEYINDYDHGRQLQVAWQMNQGGEGNNPTEAGSANDARAGSSSSAIVAASATGTSISVTSKPAFWLQSGDTVPADGSGATNGGSTSPVSDQTLTKSVQVGVDLGGQHYDNVLRHDASITFPDGARSVMIEMPTGYLRGDFSSHYTYNIDSGKLEPATRQLDSWPDAQGHMETEYSQDAVGPRHRPDPIVMATPDGQHAMAIVMSTPLPAGFDDQLLARMSFPSADPEVATQKWSALMSASNVPPGATLSGTTYQIVGDLETVKRTLAAFYASPPS